MTDQVADAGSAGSEPAPIAIPVAEHKAGGDGNLSARDAARSLVDWRRKGSGEVSRETVTEGESAEPATPTHESPEGDAAPLDEATGETETQTDPAELPPLDLPRSWTKEQAEHWKALPRATQEYLIEQAGKESAAVRKAQNEAAEHRKAVEAERQRLATLASQYESTLPQLAAMLQQTHAGEFADIQTPADVKRLANEDPVRFTQWQAHRMELGAVQAEMAEAQQRQMAEQRQQHEAFIARENARLLEKVPELSDKDTRAKIMNSAQEVFDDLGFTKEELKSLWDGTLGVSLHDHRFQRLVIDGIRYREAQQAKTTAAKTVQEKIKQLPPVQKPGTAQGRGAAAEQQISGLQKQLENTRGTAALRAAAALTVARRAQAKR